MMMMRFYLTNFFSFQGPGLRIWRQERGQAELRPSRQRLRLWAGHRGDDDEDHEYSDDDVDVDDDDNDEYSDDNVDDDDDDIDIDIAIDDDNDDDNDNNDDDAGSGQPRAGRDEHERGPGPEPGGERERGGPAGQDPGLPGLRSQPPLPGLAGAPRLLLADRQRSASARPQPSSTQQNYISILGLRPPAPPGHAPRPPPGRALPPLLPPLILRPSEPLLQTAGPGGRGVWGQESNVPVPELHVIHLNVSPRVSTWFEHLVSNSQGARDTRDTRDTCRVTRWRQFRETIGNIFFHLDEHWTMWEL